MSSSTTAALVATITQRFPTKSFGYLLSAGGRYEVDDFIMFRENLRNAAAWRTEFESYGSYFVQHDDAGFVAAPEEAWRVQQEIWDRGTREVAIFHTHQRHPANFSRIDYDMHLERFPDLWHLVISLRNPKLPQLRAFNVMSSCVHELKIHYSEGPTVPFMEVPPDVS